MQNQPTVLLVMSAERFSTVTKHLAPLADIRAASSCEEAAGLLRCIEHISLVLTDPGLPDGGWFDVVNLVDDLRPDAKVVVCARVPDERLWVQVLQAGGFDVLVEPYQETEVQRILSAISTASPANQQAAGRDRTTLPRL